MRWKKPLIIFYKTQTQRKNKCFTWNTSATFTHSLHYTHSFIPLHSLADYSFRHCSTSATFRKKKDGFLAVLPFCHKAKCSKTGKAFFYVFGSATHTLTHKKMSPPFFYSIPPTLRKAYTHKLLTRYATFIHSFHSVHSFITLQCFTWNIYFCPTL